jgi:hypothetical protein
MLARNSRATLAQLNRPIAMNIASSRGNSLPRATSTMITPTMKGKAKNTSPRRLMTPSTHLPK